MIGAIHPHVLGRMVDGLAPRSRRTPTHAHHRDRLLHRPRRARCAAQVPGRRRTSAVMYELMPAKYETCAARSTSCATARCRLPAGGRRPADPARSVARAARQGDLPRLGLRALRTPRRPQLGRGQARVREADAAQMGNFIDNVADNVIEYHCDSPVDMERTSPSFFRGDLHGIATTTYQSGATGRRPSSASTACRGSSGSTSSGRSSIRAAACSARAARRRWSWSRTSSSSSRKSEPAQMKIYSADKSELMQVTSSSAAAATW